MFDYRFRILNVPFSITGYSSFVTLISVLTSMWTCGRLFEDVVLNPSPNSFSSKIEYDFIVVGAGSAGAVAAHRLSESGRYSVLLLEAGGDPSPHNRIPAFAPFNLHLTTDWNYRTEPQKDSCFSVDEQKMHWPRGKMIGGSSQLNFMIYMRGHPKDFELLANMSGDDSWKYDNFSAGAIGTPQLLMLSGIGPAAHLVEHREQMFQINPRVDLPGVGKNLQDHVLSTIEPFILREPVSFVFDRDFSVNTLIQYELNRTGPISSNIVSGMAMVSSSIAGPDWPDLQLHMSGLGIRHGGSEDLTVCFGLKPHVLLEYLAPYSGLDANFVLVDLGRPKSSGTIELRSRDPFIHPKIDPHYFEHPDDMRAMIDGMKFVVKLYEETQVFQSIGAKLASKPLPGVKGVKGLRVADASAMPMITNANLNAPTILLGEKVAALILQDFESTE